MRLLTILFVLLACSTALALAESDTIRYYNCYATVDIADYTTSQVLEPEVAIKQAKEICTAYFLSDKDVEDYNLWGDWMVMGMRPQAKMVALPDPDMPNVYMMTRVPAASIYLKALMEEK